MESMLRLVKRRWQRSAAARTALNSAGTYPPVELRRGPIFFARFGRMFIYLFFPWCGRARETSFIPAPNSRR